MNRNRSTPAVYRAWLLPIAGAALLIAFLLSVQGTFELRGGGREMPFGRMLLEDMPYWLMWAAAAPLVFWSSERIRARVTSTVGRVLLHALVALGIMYVHSALLYKSQTVFGLTDLRIPTWRGGIALTRWRMPMNLLAYGSLLGLLIGAESRRRAAEAARQAHERELLASRLTEQLASARLHALRMQLNPHFLFNALNSVAMLVRRGDGTSAIRVLAGLSDLLRQLLADVGAPEVTLAQELAFVRQYLAIEQARFGDGLQAEFDIAPDTLEARVPSLILQPIVENAVRHGAAEATDGGIVRIATRRRDDHLVLEVSDNGPGVQESKGDTAQTGVGIRNTVERLTHLHGDRFDFDLRSDALGAVATIVLPFSPVRAAAS